MESAEKEMDDIFTQDGSLACESAEEEDDYEEEEDKGNEESDDNEGDDE